MTNKLLYLLLVMVWLITACDQDDENPYPETPANAELKVAQDENFGNILTDANGRTLYFFANDVQGAATCEGNCRAAWPVFFQEDLKAGNGLEQADLGVITREDGDKQATYKGWPLYYFVNDAAAGEIKGDGLGDIWYVAKPDYSVMLGKQEIEGENRLYLTDAEGNSLYFFLQDQENTSVCVDGCLDAWPAFFTGEVILPSLLVADDFRVADRPDDADQSSFKNLPLYYFANDPERGDINGHQVNEVWFLLSESILREEL